MPQHLRPGHYIVKNKEHGYECLRCGMKGYVGDIRAKECANPTGEPVYPEEVDEEPHRSEGMTVDVPSAIEEEAANLKAMEEEMRSFRALEEKLAAINEIQAELERLEALEEEKLMLGARQRWRRSALPTWSAAAKT